MTTRPQMNMITSNAMTIPRQFLLSDSPPTSSWTQRNDNRNRNDKAKTRVQLFTANTSKLRGITCQIGSHSLACHPTQVNAPRLNPSRQVGTRFNGYRTLRTQDTSVPHKTLCGFEAGVRGDWTPVAHWIDPLALVNVAAKARGYVAYVFYFLKDTFVR